MLRLLTYTRKSLFFFKKIKIGINLLRSSLKIITFQHYKYVIFCLLITFVQLSQILLFSFIDKTASINFMLSEFLFGQSFFETLLDYSTLPITSYSLTVGLIKTIVFCIQLSIVYFINISIAYYVYYSNITILESFKKSTQKLKLLFPWVIIEILVLFITASLGFVGDILQFIWQLSTALSIQIIAFEKINLLRMLQHNFNYFKKVFGNIVGIDLLIDGILIILTIVFYYIYETTAVPTVSLITESGHNIFATIAIFYILSAITVLEVITFTKLYGLVDHHASGLKK